MRNIGIGVCCIFILLFIATNVINPSIALPKSRTISGSRPPGKHFTKVKVPFRYRLPPAQGHQFKGQDIVVDLFAEKFAQGMAVYAEIYFNPSAQDKNFTVKKFSFDGRDILLSKRPWGYRALFGINPETPVGMNKIQIAYSVGGSDRAETFGLTIARTDYQFSVTPLDLGKYSDVDYRPTPEELEFINRCTAKKNKVFSMTGTDRLGESFSHPRNRHFITSPFWSKRLIMKYRIMNGNKTRLGDQLNIHKGIDLRGKSGNPVYSMADGTVVIAERMYYEGNFIVIDHGNKIFSYYMHLNELKVKEGAQVSAGDLIGRVGSTGLSTAAHLHVSVLLQDIYVDPLSLLVLPVRN
jgi:murein DD-endopeptidase